MRSRTACPKQFTYYNRGRRRTHYARIMHTFSATGASWHDTRRCRLGQERSYLLSGEPSNVYDTRLSRQSTALAFRPCSLSKTCPV